jgi:hypothetical protein
MKTKKKITIAALAFLYLSGCGTIEKNRYREVEATNQISNQALRTYEIANRFDSKYAVTKDEYAAFNYVAAMVIAFDSESKKLETTPSANLKRSGNDLVSEMLVGGAVIDIAGGLLTGVGFSGFSVASLALGLLGGSKESTDRFVIIRQYELISKNGFSLVKLLTKADATSINATINSEFATLDDMSLKLGAYQGCKSGWAGKRVSSQRYYRLYPECDGSGLAESKFGYFNPVSVFTEQITKESGNPLAKYIYDGGIISRLTISNSSTEPHMIYQKIKNQIPDDWYAVFKGPNINGKPVVVVAKAGTAISFDMPPNPLQAKALK